LIDEKDGQDYELISEDDENSQQFSDIEVALKELPERQRMALNLCFYEDLSNNEAASIMGIRLKALQSLIMRGKASLKAYFNTSEENNHEHK
jgi:RNA polymerase sigma-70 factor (ECF subfamily)